MEEKIGDLTLFLRAIHALTGTGTDITSKFGTNAPALKIAPESYLHHFETNHAHKDMESILKEAENFLVQVLKSGTKCSFLDELCYSLYHYNKHTTNDQLPPTSHATKE